MTARRTAAGIGLVVAAAAAIAWQRPASDIGVISGTVVTSEPTPAPVRRAIVTLSGDLSAERGAVTDEAGHFTFDRVPPGRFTLTAHKAAYLTNAFGAKAPGRPGTPISLARGERVTDLTVPLPRGGVLTGVITDERQDALSGIAVVAALADGSNSSASVRQQTAYTDDRGVYRIFGLPPGAYVVGATVGTTTNVTVPGVPANVFETRSTREVDALLAFLRASQTAGVSPTLAPPAAPPSEPAVYAAAPVFYPGTPRVSEALPVSIGVGEERAGLDFIVAPVRSAVVEGSVTGLAADQSVGVFLRSTSRTLEALPALQPTVVAMPSRETFKFTNVEPGEYVLLARTISPAPETTFTTSDRGTTVSSRAPGAAPAPSASPAGGSPMLWGSASFAVNGSDVTGVSIALQPVIRLVGRAALDAADGTSAPPSVAAARFTLAPDDRESQGEITFTSMLANLQTGAASGSSSRATTNAASDAAGRVTFTGLLPMTYRLSGSIAGAPDWWLRSAVVNGRDILDVPLSIVAGENPGEAEFTFTNRHSELTGTLQNAGGQPATEFTVVVAPVDHALWLPGARRVRSTRPSSDGRFSFRDLPAGSYHLAALTDVTAPDLEDPAFLAAVAAASIPATVTDGTRTVQDVRLAGR